MKCNGWDENRDGIAHNRVRSGLLTRRTRRAVTCLKFQSLKLKANTKYDRKTAAYSKLEPQTATTSPDDFSPSPSPKLVSFLDFSKMSSLYNLEPQPTASVILHTTSGDISFELFAQQTPLTSRNFLQHCLDGYY